MPGILILNPKRLSEVKSGPTESRIKSAGRETSNDESEERGWAGVARRDVGRLAGGTWKEKVRGQLDGEGEKRVMNEADPNGSSAEQGGDGRAKSDIFDWTCASG
jgi:hypothetical protein